MAIIKLSSYDTINNVSNYSVATYILCIPGIFGTNRQLLCLQKSFLKVNKTSFYMTYVPVECFQDHYNNSIPDQYTKGTQAVTGQTH